MYVYPLRAEKPGLHPNLTCVHGDRGCGNPIPREMRKPNPRRDGETQSLGECGNTTPADVAETRGFALSMPKAKKVLNACHGRHCANRAQTSSNVTPTVDFCPPHLTFRIKVRVRRGVPKKTKCQLYVYILRLCHLSLGRGVLARATRPAPKAPGRGPAHGQSAHDPPARHPARALGPRRHAHRLYFSGTPSAHPEPTQPTCFSRRVQQHTLNAPGPEPVLTATPETPHAQQQPSPLTAAACNSMRVWLLWVVALVGACDALPDRTTSLRCCCCQVKWRCKVPLW